METINLFYKNHANLTVDAPDGILMEMREHFSFFVDGYRHMPKYKSGVWDGKIRLLDYYKRSLPAGLVHEVRKFAKSFGYQVVTHANEYGEPGVKNIPSKEDIKSFFEGMVLTDGDGNRIAPRDYQLDLIHRAITDKRLLGISPTASGKSLAIYILIRWLQRELPDGQKIVLIVPRTQLVEQMYGDFADYSQTDDSWFVEDHCHRIYSGKEKETDKEVIITTWQSMAKLPRSFKSSIYATIGDEAHTFAAKVLSGIMDSLVNCSWRIGVTGSLKGSKCNDMFLAGIFGEIVKFISTRELMDRGLVAQLGIEALLLEYPDELRKSIGKAKYPDEIKFINAYEERNKFISNLALGLKGNSLIAFRMIDHGKGIYERLKAQAPDREIYYVSGETKTEVREELRAAMEKGENAIIVASVVFLTGVNIKNINNIILAAPSKSLITVVQTIGRGLRKAQNGLDTKLYDIIDDLSWKSRKNFALNHGSERLKIYHKEKFDYRTHRIKLN